jgi:hypothetical protein
MRANMRGVMARRSHFVGQTPWSDAAVLTKVRELKAGVAVSLLFANHHASLPVAFQLYLPTFAPGMPEVGRIQRRQCAGAGGARRAMPAAVWCSCLR